MTRAACALILLNLLLVGGRASAFLRCALVLRTEGGDKNERFYFHSVVPLGDTDVPVAGDGEEAKAILACQLVALLKDTHSSQRQRHLI